MKIIKEYISRQRGIHPFNNLTPIVSDGGMSLPFFGDGRLIPALVLDCENNKVVLSAFYLGNDDCPPGDIVSTWMRSRFTSDYVYLSLEFQRPIETQIVIPFHVFNQGGLVDGIITNRGVYLQPKEVGAKVSDGLGKEQLLVEIPPTTTFPEWDSLYKKKIFKYFKSQGASTNEAKADAEKHLKRVRELWSRRPSQ